MSQNERFYHVSGGKAYGPSMEGESLSDYKARVRRAYGNLSGVTFGTRSDLNPCYFW